MQRFIEQPVSNNLSKSILGKVEALIEKDQKNASKLQILEELNREAMEIAEEPHCRLKEVRLNLTTPLTSEAEASEPENYSEARLKTISRANITSDVPVTLPQEVVVPTCNSSHSKLR